MATVVHNNFRDAQMGTPASPTLVVDFDTNDIDCGLFNATQSGGIDATDKALSDINGGTGPVADRTDSTDVPLLSKTVGGVSGIGTGVFDAANVTFDTIGAGTDGDYLSLYQYNATAANATLIATWDSTTTGLVVVPNGGDITVTWSVSGIVGI